MTGLSSAKKVRFESVEIYEHGYELGDNPSVSEGAPLTIGWKRQDSLLLDLDCYEQTRKRRRSCSQLRLQVHQRVSLLLSSGYTMEDIVRCALDVHRHKQNRSDTLKQMKWDGLTMAFGTVGKTLRKVARRGSALATAPFRISTYTSNRARSSSVDEFEDSEEFYPSKPSSASELDKEERRRHSLMNDFGMAEASKLVSAQTA